MTPDQRTYYEYILSIMLKTRDARFTASHRLAMENGFSIVIVVLLSTYILSLSVALLVFDDQIQDISARYLGVLISTASAMILGLSILDYAADRGTKADRLQRNALRITRTMRRIERELKKQSPNIGLIDQYCEEYETENNENGMNHHPIDYKISLYRRLPANSIPNYLRKYILRSVFMCAALLRAIWLALFSTLVIFAVTAWILLSPPAG